MAAKTMTLKPAPGRRVVDPATMLPLPEGGALVERTGFWIRRLKDGDVVEIAATETSNSTSGGEG